MSTLYSIEHTEKSDLPFIHELFGHSIRYQEQHGYPVWKNYDRGAIERDIGQKNQYKLLAGSKTAMVFSVCYADPIIWRERETGNALYLHRIVVNPAFKGQRLFGRVVDWSVHHGIGKGLSYVRMDTWAANPRLISYYQGFGFRFVEHFTTPDSPGLPVHNRRLDLALLEYPIATG